MDRNHSLGKHWPYLFSAKYDGIKHQEALSFLNNCERRAGGPGRHEKTCKMPMCRPEARREGKKYERRVDGLALLRIPCDCRSH